MFILPSQRHLFVWAPNQLPKNVAGWWDTNRDKGAVGGVPTAHKQQSQFCMKDNL